MGTTRDARRVLAVSIALTGVPAAADCGDEARLHALDFWQGRWIVSAGSEFVGHNIIEKSLDGCAVTESWLDFGGHAGFSLFWYDRETDRWKQVWVTDRALRTGGTKEKQEVRELTSPVRIRFEGRYTADPGGRIIHDRTTLTHAGPDHVRQLIEVSIDGGKTWNTEFDGDYRPAD